MSTRAERRRMEKAAAKDTRYCYGANCTWHGPISETGVTRPIAGMHRLPCCLANADITLAQMNFLMDIGKSWTLNVARNDAEDPEEKP